VELGGEILTKGHNKSKNKAWVVGVESPQSKLEDRSTSVNIMLKNKGMASSGNYRKFRVDSITGKKYVHTLNPLTGSAEQSDVTSATVIANSCAEADAYATACMALGFEKAKELLKSMAEVEGYLTYTDSLSMGQVFISEGFQKHIIY
jgi:thiamine biosynthesis lipoprotein